MMSWQTILAIGSGAFLGAVLRAYMNGVVNTIFRIPSPLELCRSILSAVLLSEFFSHISATQLFLAYKPNRF